MGKEATWSKMSIVGEHHMYKTGWTLYIGQSLQLCCEDDNEHNDNEHNDHAVSARMRCLAPSGTLRHEGV